MTKPVDLAMQMLSENVEALRTLESDREKVDTRFKIATTATRLAECDKHTLVHHEWLGPKPPVCEVDSLAETG
jgi:hypothetical protein